jgi:hypothetical protein
LLEGRKPHVRVVPDDVGVPTTGATMVWTYRKSGRWNFGAVMKDETANSTLALEVGVLLETSRHRSLRSNR